MPMPRDKRLLLRTHIFIAWVFFLFNGALNLWTPGWSLCFPLWGLPLTMAAIVFFKLIGAIRKEGRAALRQNRWVAISAILILLHGGLGANRVWLRWGIEIRLWRAGGIRGLESWVSTYIAKRQNEWVRIGGPVGWNNADDATKNSFFWVPRQDLPPALTPLCNYLPEPTIVTDSNGPTGMDFRLAGWDHGWGLHVSKNPLPDRPRFWPYSLGKRSYIHGTL